MKLEKTKKEAENFINSYNNLLMNSELINVDRFMSFEFEVKKLEDKLGIALYEDTKSSNSLNQCMKIAHSFFGRCQLFKLLKKM